VDKQRFDRIWSSAVIAVLAVAVLFPGVAWGHPAIKVVDWIWFHLGGKEAYEHCRYVEFTWTYEHEGNVKTTRSHTWDRYKGDYVLEFTDSKTNDAYMAYFNVHSKKGVAIKNGAAVGQDENARLVERAYSMFINDTYWLLLPMKLTDPGARLQFVGHASRTGSRDIEGSDPEGTRMVDLTVREEDAHDHTGHGQGDEGAEDVEETLVVLHLWFQKEVGLTPRDEYWLYVTHDGAIVGWRYVLQDGDEGEWEWMDEKDCGMGIKLPTKRISADGSRAIVFPNVKFSDTMDRGVFQPSPGG
jgi:hypothetical protein